MKCFIWFHAVWTRRRTKWTLHNILRPPARRRKYAERNQNSICWILKILGENISLRNCEEISNLVAGQFCRLPSNESREKRTSKAIFIFSNIVSMSMPLFIRREAWMCFFLCVKLNEIRKKWDRNRQQVHVESKACARWIFVCIVFVQ